MKPAGIIVILLSAFAVVHVLRLVFQVSIVVGSVAIPMWASVLGVLVPGGLAFWLWREQREG